MIAALSSLLLVTQLSAPFTLQEDRLRACLSEARNDPATAITTSVQWLEGTYGSERSYPEQCLGFAYMSLLRWDAARTAFISARNSRAADDLAGRARLGGMAGNAALAAEDYAAAADLLGAAQADATSAGDASIAGEIAADHARALVGTGDMERAAGTLAQAREWAPQDGAVWLLSATLARRMDDLATAQGFIQTAALLDPANPAIGLEAGLIAVLGGFDDAARASWQSVVTTAAGTAEAATAQDYLTQLDGAVPTR